VNRELHCNALGFKETELIDAGIQPTVPGTFRSIKTHNDADQLTAERIQTDATNWTDVAYFYNDNGGLESITTEGTEQQSFDYDYNNRLKSVDDASRVIEYIYDASGARLGRITDNGSLITTNLFVIDYADGLKRPLAETDASGNITRYYVWSGSHLPCHIEADGTTRYYHADELGSTLALTDETGVVTDEFAYMPYGYATHMGTIDTPFQWLGGYGVYYDSTTDLHLTLHRAYSSSMKRFISPDPLGIDGGKNVYMWANMNPLSFVDPYGLCAGNGISSWALSLIGAGISCPFGGFVSLSLVWDTEGNVGIAINGEIGVGVEVGFKSDLLDLALGHLPEKQPGDVNDLTGHGETGRAHFLFGTTINDPLNPESQPEFSINPSAGGGVYKTGTISVPIIGPDAPSRYYYPMTYGQYFN
jgi:RHS repeat-associated protein